jgi:hypothetical protein
VQLFSYY